MAVNSAHHQAVATPAPAPWSMRWRRTGWWRASNPRHRFALGVQWHPEYAVDPADPLIFARLRRGLPPWMTSTTTTIDQPEPDAERGERIAKWLARAGVASRRDAEKLIAERRVKLENKVVETPATFIQPGDLVTVDGRIVANAQRTPAVPLPQAGRAGDHPQGREGPPHRLRAPCRPACRAWSRSAGST